MQGFAYMRPLRAGDDLVGLASWHPDCVAFDASQAFSILRWRPIAGNVSGVQRAGQLLQPLLLARHVLQRESFDEVWT